LISCTSRKKNENEPHIQPIESRNELATDKKDAEASNEPRDTVTITHGKPAYNSESSFFDNLNLNTNKKREEETESKGPTATVKSAKEDFESQRRMDTETFGSVAKQYKFASRQRSSATHNRGTKAKGPVRQYQNSDNFGYRKKPYSNSQYRGQQQVQAKTSRNKRYTTAKEPRPQKYQSQKRQPQRPMWQPRQ